MYKQSITPRKGVFMLLSVIAILIVISSVIGHLSQKKEEPVDDGVPDTSNVHILGSDLLQPSTVTYKGESGITYTIGCDELVELEDGMGLPLSPMADTAEKKVGFKMTATEGALYYANSYDMAYVNATNPYVKSFGIVEWTDRTLFDASFKISEQYGVALAINNEVMERIKNGETDDRILIRTVDLSNKSFLDAFYVSVGVNEEGKCYLKDAHSLDVSESEYDSYRAEMCKFAISGINDDGWSISSVTKADGSKDYSVHNRYSAIPEAKRYVVEQLDMDTYTTYVLNRGEQGKAISADVLNPDIYPIFAVTPCYDAATAKRYGLYTIYLYPAFLNGSTTENFSYLGYSDWANTKCIVTNVN